MSDFAQIQNTFTTSIAYPPCHLRVVVARIATKLTGKIKRCEKNTTIFCLCAAALLYAFLILTNPNWRRYFLTILSAPENPASPYRPHSKRHQSDFDDEYGKFREIRYSSEVGLVEHTVNQLLLLVHAFSTGIIIWPLRFPREKMLNTRCNGAAGYLLGSC